MKLQKYYFPLPEIYTFSGAILQNITDDFGNSIQVCTLPHFTYMCRRGFFKGYWE